MTRPPQAHTDDVVDDIHGVKVADPYRWLENGDSAESQQYVHEEMEYTRSILDKLPGREAIHARLTELLTVGALSTPHIGGSYYFYRRRDGNQRGPAADFHFGIDDMTVLLPDVEDENFVVADGPASMPVPPDNGGAWVHPINGKLHVHYKNIAEPVLMR